MLRAKKRLRGQRDRKQAVAKRRNVKSRLDDAVICVYDDAGNVIETHEYKGDFKEPQAGLVQID